MTSPVVTLKGISVSIEGAKILEGLSLDVHENEFFGIVGPNGGGKTTLLRVILGLQKPTSGCVTVFGKEPLLSRKKVGYVPQHASFSRDFPISVGDAVLMGRLSRKKLFRPYNQEDRTLVEEALQTVGIAGLKEHHVGGLSGGELQRMLIARALVGRPALLLLDEPTASIDPVMKTTIYDLLDTLKDDMTIILVTHDTGTVSKHVSRVACLNSRASIHTREHITHEELSDTYRYPVTMVKHGPPDQRPVTGNDA